ncbi:MAG: type II toxin-antitoxin system HicB family antitoxin [Bacteroidetes bacterium]|nr:type II toxin-antitoxin system HicB family antitoxin [Bacteroidota bacterium]
MKKQLKLTAIFVPAEEGGYTAYIEEIRGVVSEGDSLKEAEENLMDALALMLETSREEAENLPQNNKQIIRKEFSIAV